METEGPQISGEMTIVTPVYLSAEPVLWLIAFVFAVAYCFRDRTWRSTLLCIAFCCMLLPSVPMMISFLFPTSEAAFRITSTLLVPFLWTRIIGVLLLTIYVISRWRGARK